MNAADLLEPSQVVLNVKADSKRQALAAVAAVAARAFKLTTADVLQALMSREEEGSTGVGYGVALPHARLKGLTTIGAAAIRLETPIAFDAVDDQRVDIIFALFAPLAAGSEPLRTLARASRLLRQRHIRDRLRQARTADAFYAVLMQDASVSAA